MSLLLEMCRGAGMVRVPLERLKEDEVIQLRDKGLIECGNEVRNPIAANFHDGIVFAGGEPTAFAWLRLTAKGREFVGS